jgi:uncharacterized protein YgbK (DUF1537 family)
LNGVPIHATEFGSDPRTPVRDSDLPRLFAPLGRQQALLGLADLRVPEADLARTLTSLVSQERSVLVCDADEEADLARVVRAVAATGLTPLWVGSTGLAGHVGGYFRPEPKPQITDLPESLAPGLIIAGTASEHTRAQFDFLSKSAGIALIKLDPRALVADPAAAQTEQHRCRQRALAAVQQGQAAALGVLSSREEVAEVVRLGAASGLSPAEVAARITTALAQLARDLVEAAPALSGLVLTGGDTASAVCAALEARAIQIIREVEPGIPLTRLVGPWPIPVVIKAGAFGSPQALLNSLKHLTRYT